MNRAIQFLKDSLKDYKWRLEAPLIAHHIADYKLCIADIESALDILEREQIIKRTFANIHGERFLSDIDYSTYEEAYANKDNDYLDYIETVEIIRDAK